MIEYLKGSGGDRVTGVAHGYPRDGSDTLVADTREAAAEKARRLLDGRDRRWDGREGIVFLQGTPEGESGHTPQHLDYYWLGDMGLYSNSDRQFTVASGQHRSWLPDASATSTPGSGDARGSEGPAVEQHFLLEDPGGVSGSSAAGESGDLTPTPAAESITLSALKGRISALEAEIAASSAPEAYRDCVLETEFANRPNPQRALRAMGDHVLIMPSSFESGLSAGTTVVAFPDPVETWFEGGSAHLFDHTDPGKIKLLRPLPAGEYRAFLLWRSLEMAICDGYLKNIGGRYENVFTVTAPEGTLAEALFDPVADGAAFSATTTVGIIGWEAGVVSAALNQDVADHVLDFIALDGTVSLSLVAASATSTSGRLSWPVTDQPWSDGDQLMVRIRLVRQ